MANKTQKTVYQIYVHGYNNMFDTLPEVAAWVAELKIISPSIIGRQATVIRCKQYGDVIVSGAGCQRKILTVSPEA